MRSHPAKYGEGFDAPPTLERSGSERRGGAVSSLFPEGERVGVRGGALFNGKEGRGDFRKNSFNSFSNLRNQFPSMGNNPNIAIGMFPQKRFYDRSE